MSKPFVLQGVATGVEKKDIDELSACTGGRDHVIGAAVFIIKESFVRQDFHCQSQ
jgi:hypothetical protein